MHAIVKYHLKVTHHFVGFVYNSQSRYRRIHAPFKQAQKRLIMYNGINHSPNAESSVTGTI